MLKTIEQTSKWIEEAVLIFRQLEVDESKENLKEAIYHLRSFEKYIEGMISLDDNEFTEFYEKVLSFVRKTVPDTFRKWSMHHDWYGDIEAKYPSLSRSKSDMIGLMGNSLESICAWSMHRLYVLDEHPRFRRRKN